MTEIALYLEHNVIYSNREPLPVQDVVDSLLAMRRLSRTMLPRALSQLTGSKIIGAELLVEGFEEGSFKQSFWLRLIFSSERSMKRFQKAFREGDLASMYRELPLQNRPVTKAVVISSLVAAFVAYGVARFVARDAPAEQRALVEANNNTIVAIGAEAYQADPDAFAKVIAEVAAGRTKLLAQDAAKILAPAHREPGTTVTFGDQSVIENGTVRAMPTEVEFEQQETEENLSNVVVDIRSTNRDSETRGWHAHVVGMFDDRVKLSLGDHVSIDDLAGKLQVRADVVVRYRMNPAKKKMVPVEILVIALRHDAADKAPPR